MRLARALHVDDAHGAFAQLVDGVTAERAHDRGLEAEPRARRGGNHGAAADRRHERRRSDFFAARRQVRQPHENQVLECFADGEEIDARHARKYNPAR